MATLDDAVKAVETHSKDWAEAGRYIKPTEDYELAKRAFYKSGCDEVYKATETLLSNPDPRICEHNLVFLACTVHSHECGPYEPTPPEAYKAIIEAMLAKYKTEQNPKIKERIKNSLMGVADNAILSEGLTFLTHTYDHEKFWAESEKNFTAIIEEYTKTFNERLDWTRERRKELGYEPLDEELYHNN